MTLLYIQFTEDNKTKENNAFQNNTVRLTNFDWFQRIQE